MNTQSINTWNVITLRIRAGDRPEALCFPAFGELDAAIIVAEPGARAETVLKAAEAAWGICAITLTVSAIAEEQNAAAEWEALRERTHALILVPDDRLDRASEGLADLLRNAAVGSINLDAADYRTLLLDAPGPVHLGIGEASAKGEYEAAIESAAHSDLTGTGLENARRVIVSLAAAPGFNMEDVSWVMERLRSLTQPNANMMFALNYDERLPDSVMRLMVLAVDYSLPEV